MKEIIPIGTVFAFTVICCILIESGGSLVFLGMKGSTLVLLTGIGAIASFGYFFFGKK